MLEVKFKFSPLHSHSHIISNASAILLNRFSIRSLLTTSIPATLVQATVISYLDYCNSLTGLPISTFASSFNMFSLDQAVTLLEYWSVHVTPLIKTPRIAVHLIQKKSLAHPVTYKAPHNLLLALPQYLVSCLQYSLQFAPLIQPLPTVLWTR